MVKKSLLTATAALVISFAGSAFADEIVVNGKPCNSFCQAWLGVKPATPAATSGPAATVAPVVRRPEIAVRQPAAPMRATVDLEPSVRKPTSRVASTEPSSTTVEAVTRASVVRRRESVVSRPAESLEQPMDLRPVVRPSPARVASTGGSSDVVVAVPPAAALPAVPRPATVTRPGKLASPAVLASVPPAPTAALNPDQGADVPEYQPEVDQADAPASPRSIKPRTAHDRMGPRAARQPVETALPGPLKLPPLSSLVAVRGAIIVETSADRAVRQRLLADMEKATSRPRQPKQALPPFETGEARIGQP